MNEDVFAMEGITPERWRRVKDVASLALDQDRAARADFVLQACGADAELRVQVLSLLASAEAATPFFEAPAGAAGATLLPPDTRIGPYRIVRELASGGMGSVYLAERDGEFRQRVAIKIVRGGFPNRFLLERFREERRILASLEHPNIARLLDGGTTDTGLPYVAMEYIEGQPIDVFCDGRGLPLRGRLAIFRQVCAAVHYAHQHLVIHRDIKAANILETADGIPKLLDFGIAKLLQSGPASAYGPFTTVRVMTPESASPEQVTGQPITVASDVYALGILLYRLLTGRSPYRGPLDSDAALVRAVVEEIPERPSVAVGRRMKVPADVDMIVMRTLRKEPDRRYESAGQLSEDIDRFLHGRPVLASPDSLPYRSRKFIARHGVAMTGAAAVLIALIGGIAATSWQARAAERERVRAQREFNAVRGLANAVLGELNEAVRALPGSTRAQEILLRRATEYLDALSAEAHGDVALQRELADGYIKLGTVQGLSGLPNLGDQVAMRASYTKAIRILEPIVASDRVSADDRARLALALIRVADLEKTNTGEDAANRERAKALLDGLSPAQRAQPFASSVLQVVLEDFASARINAQDYAGARAALEEKLQVADASFRAQPDNFDASRNLSLTYKRLGAVLEVLHLRDQAIPLYQKAMALDQQRVAAQPATPMWRLDLSFSYGALGAALRAAGDLKGALTNYEQAIALRERIVAEDPADDFARTSLANGYSRLAYVHALSEEPAATLEYSRKRIQVMADRYAAHPERRNAGKDYADTVRQAIYACLDALERPAIAARQRAALSPAVAGMVDDLTRLQTRVEKATHAEGVATSAEEMQKIHTRLAHLTKRQ